ncbi:hypothetical protein L1987_12485 [Smallanthus sonchifolius]|uniref:Uncharacterized protein n=1 Tax=Smallanthus sonchifolius TaxID=185202 RepID=A0ACB9JEG5_9ASTR|nr:hypothetical protein L1987_12485 [Smallanthus sonchifolius]
MIWSDLDPKRSRRRRVRPVENKEEVAVGDCKRISIESTEEVRVIEVLEGQKIRGFSFNIFALSHVLLINQSRRVSSIPSADCSKIRGSSSQVGIVAVGKNQWHHSRGNLMCAGTLI